jgi:hypothetical protein
MGSKQLEAGEIEAAFGLRPDEILHGHGAAMMLLQNERVKAALSTLETAAPGLTDFFYQMLLAKSLTGAFGEAGKALAVITQQGSAPSGERWMTLLQEVMAAPPTHADIADWWLLFGSLNAAFEFQATHSAPQKTEKRLTGEFIAELKHAGIHWAGLLAPMLKRRGACFAFHQIDLERLGGEQDTGGDFGLVLDFDGLTFQPAAFRSEARKVPLIFQAKRYVRPLADVSQTHKVRGPQKNKLRGNTCASAYIFYENGDTAIPTPLPVLVKPILNVGAERLTSVFQGTVDFASYLYRASTDDQFAPRAASVDQALSMIFAAADPGQLSRLVVASGAPNARLKYEAAIAHFAAHYGPDVDDPVIDGEENKPDVSPGP